ncbi:MAG: 4Fe-4S binding protein [Sterolibacterium sp.]|jgi:NosR/NirI family nitrous oxide reductase transcriptional regulator|nr:4Fe-4S binding protein [Sterolibacterium sp.]
MKNMKFVFNILGMLLLLGAMPVWADSYEAPLPHQISSDPDMCAYAPCKEVIPGADSFSPRKGRPPYVEAYQTTGGQKKLLGYVFLSTDIVDIPAYSGKPVVTLIGMDTHGVFTGAKVLKHSEPILLLGIPESKLIDFIHQYVHKFVGDKVEIGKSHVEPGYVNLDAISGATVTVIAQNQVMMRCGLEIAKQVGIVKPKIRPPAKFAPLNEKLSWAQLLKEGSVQRLAIQATEVGLPPSSRPFIDMNFGYLNTPSVGRSILGDSGYTALMARLKPGEHAIFIIANGAESFKGSGFVRGGIYDRVQVNQEGDVTTFRDLDYLNLYGIEAAGAPVYQESAIFIIRNASFSGAYPWDLVFLGNKVDRDTGMRTFATFEQEYWVPGRYLEGGRPEYQRADPTWLKVWKSRPLEIALFALLLLSAGGVYAMRDTLVRRAERKDKRWVSIPKYTLWMLSIGYAGFYLMAQPSITQVLTWFHSILFQWEWGLFLSDPFIFLFWVFIIITTFFWGRGMFCGWLCPYGSLSEIIFKIAGKIGLKRFQTQLPDAWHDRLKWLKYVIFLGLLFVSFYSMGLAEKLAEVEPFKTTFLVGVWNRSWPFVLYFSVLFILAMFIERFFCKYLCPLGASLAIPSTFRWWGLKRKSECGPCKACAVGCGSQAIDGTAGSIDQRECLLCLDCMVMYYDDHACPPLAQERKARTKAGQPLTAIGASGYYIPIQPVPSTPPAQEQPKIGMAAWLYGELIDHLFPWRSQAVRGRNVIFKAMIAALTVLVTWIWLLGAAGKLGTGIILGWWLAWSVYEIIERMHSKPYVKEGPWWGRNLRPARWPDMMAYVGMKNLLIGVALFLLMKAVGVLAFLQGMPELKGFY